MVVDHQVILVTGANKGIGYKSVELLSKSHPESVILLGARDENRGNEAVSKLSANNVHFLQLDATDSKSIDAAVQTVADKYGKLNVLINNAGIGSSSGGLEEVKKTFDVNYFGAQRVIGSFLPLLKKSREAGEDARVLIVSSEVGAWSHNLQPEDLQKVLDEVDNLSVQQLNDLSQDFLTSVQTDKKSMYDWKDLFNGYGPSKTLVSVYGRVIARELKGDGIVVVLLCPGYCATDLNNNSGYRSAEQGAESINYGLKVKLAETGGFFQDGHAQSIKSEIPEAMKAAIAKHQE
ncbi:carbonyl reductase [Acrasis kona]|uniref:Carbonyl reductase n=1 Tax=Acrasis kona TaxID=1008807 RepID=A0AAW2Z1T2_9EUKA